MGCCVRAQKVNRAFDSGCFSCSLTLPPSLCVVITKEWSKESDGSRVMVIEVPIPHFTVYYMLIGSSVLML